jgi:hypothetical protein
MNGNPTRRRFDDLLDTFSFPARRECSVKEKLSTPR